MNASDGRAPSSTLDFIATVAAEASETSKVIRRIVADYRTPVRYPATFGAPNPLVKDLQTVAALIQGGFPAQVYYLALGGFDTHFNQAAVQPKLMTQWGGAVKAFWTDLKRQKLDHRVVILTFSEFGRRTAENYSKGTDHGAAGPMFVYGTPVKGGIYGKHPSLTDLDQGDLKAWDTYLVIFTPEVLGPDRPSAMTVKTRIQYDTRRMRKLIATGDDLRVLDDVRRILRPLLPLDADLPAGEGDTTLDLLVGILQERGIDPRTTEALLRAHRERASLLWPGQ